MNSGKKISAWWNNLLCFLFGHTLTTVCTRCGKLVNLEGTERLTLEDRINNYFKNRKERKLNPDKAEYKGSLKLNHNLRKYSIDLKTNELRLVEYVEEKEPELEWDGSKKLDKHNNIIYKVKARKAPYNPYCVYIDALNDEIAIRKANTVLLGLKKGIRIKHITRNEPKYSNTVTL